MYVLYFESLVDFKKILAILVGVSMIEFRRKSEKIERKILYRDGLFTDNMYSEKRLFSWNWSEVLTFLRKES